jgi:hypothetical protein
MPKSSESVSEQKESKNSESNIILAIIFEASDNIKSFKRSWTELHSFFYEMKKSNEFSALFEDFLFDNNGPYPYCEKIDEIFSEFQLTGIISSPNPILKEYMINIKKNLTDEIVIPLNVESDEIKKIATLFSQKLGSNIG